MEADRYIQFFGYENGAEELYDRRTDPHEWTNLAKDPAVEATKAELGDKLQTMLGRHKGSGSAR